LGAGAAGTFFNSLSVSRASDNNIPRLIHDVRLVHLPAVHGHNPATVLPKSRRNPARQCLTGRIKQEQDGR
jgi:hypothetical protein